MVTASSQHGSGVHVAVADGHIRYVSGSIEDRVWWGFGSRNGGETFVNFE
jgi:hypothetical protein